MVMPKEYRKVYMTIVCNDCLKHSKVKFHIMNKCQECKSYNTAQTGGLITRKGKTLDLERPGEISESSSEEGEEPNGQFQMF